MKKRMAAIIAAVALGLGGALVASPAFADEIVEPQTVEVYWLLPEGIVPVEGQAVGSNAYPQAYLPLGAADLQCGQWAQVDTYTVEEAAKFTADTVLTYKEDWPNEYQTGAISWRFETGDCTVTPGVPTFEDVCSSGEEPSYVVTLPAEDPRVTFTVESDSELLRVRVVAVAVEPYVLASGEDKDVWQFEYTNESCPTPPPPPNEPPKLAETGPADAIPGGIFGLVLALIGGAFIAASRKRWA